MYEDIDRCVYMRVRIKKYIYVYVHRCGYAHVHKYEHTHTFSRTDAHIPDICEYMIIFQ